MSSSSDEGEIRDEGTGELKASHQNSRAENGVDRRGRHSDSSPIHDSASRGSRPSRRSPSPRGSKRSRDDGDHYGAARDHDLGQPRARRDDRPSNGYYASTRDRDSRPFYHSFDQSPRDDYRRTRVSYDDLDRPSSRASNHLDSRPPSRNNNFDQYRTRDHDRDRRRGPGRSRGRDKINDHRRLPDSHEPPRRRSRSPERSRHDHKISGNRLAQEWQIPSRNKSPLPAWQRNGQDRISMGGEHASRRTDSFRQQNGATKDGKAANVAPTADESTTEPSPETDFEPPQPIDEDAEIERRRKRREELLAKSTSATPLLLHAAGTAAEKATRVSSPASTQPETHRSSLEVGTPRSPSSDWASPRSPPPRDGPSPGGDGNLLDDKGLMNTHGNSVVDDEQDGPSAADYDPTVDMQEDERRDERRHGQSVIHGEPQPVDESAPQTAEQPGADSPNQSFGQGGEDDEFDMFAEEFDEARYAAQRETRTRPQGEGGMLEGDDKEGFYKVRIGEVLKERYEVKATIGQGMFARVARAVDAETQRVVAIKIMRNNYALRRGGYTEIAILRKLNDDDAANKKHIVRFEQSFDHRGHLCMVFEGLEMNLRDVLRKFGNKVGINLEATRRFAKQIFIALDHMRKNKIIHADLKPDNILINETRQLVKICDLGTAIDRDDAATAHSEVTPYLISRFYRAPEVILGMDYDYGIDMWSIGCTLFELFTGKILFPGESNNQMLKVIMQMRGRMHPKYYKRGQLWHLHFDDKENFVSIECDKVTQKEVKRIMTVIPTRSLGSRLEDAGAGMTSQEKQDLEHFRDLLDGCLTLHSDRRMTPTQALQHAFFKATTNPR